MKVFFLAAIADITHSKRVLELLNEICTKKHYTLNADYFLNALNNNLDKLSRADLEAHYKNLVHELKTSDALVFEGTHPSTGCGHLLTVALQNHIPCLYLNMNQYTGPLIADQNRLLKIEIYNGSESTKLENRILKFFNFAQGKKLNIRFNLMIDESMSNFLEYKSKDNNMSKADYIRNLILKDMDVS